MLRSYPQSHPLLLASLRERRKLGGGGGGVSNGPCLIPEDCLKGLLLPATGPGRQVSRTGSKLVQKPCVGRPEGFKSPSWLAGCPLSLGHREKWAWPGKVVWNGPLRSSLGAFKNEFPGKEDSPALGRILGRVSWVCSDLTNASRNHPAVCVPAVPGARGFPRCSVSRKQQPKHRDVCFKACAKSQGQGYAKESPHRSFAPLVQMHTFLASQGMADATSDARGAHA